MNDNENLIRSIGELFFEFQAKLQFFEREYLQKFGVTDVTPTEVKVLYIIGLSNTKSMSEIADELKITRGTLSTTIDSLVKKGYVIRTRHKQDRRVVIVYLTKRSLNVVRLYGQFYHYLLLTLIEDMTKAEANFVKEILNKLNEIIESNFYEGVEYLELDNEIDEEKIKEDIE